MPAGIHAGPLAFLQKLGVAHPDQFPVHYQNSPEDLILQTLSRMEGELSDTGALAVSTGTFTGRCPEARYLVQEGAAADLVDWNAINQPLAPEHYARLHARVTQYLGRGPVWVRDCALCADARFRLPLRLVTDRPWASLFCHNMFLRPEEEALERFRPSWTILHAPGLQADPQTDGVRQGHFVVIHFGRRTLLIGGTAYTGEIKKGMFSVLNLLLPQEKDVLSMHCSANRGAGGDTALFFGLSGTGKTTLSNDAERALIGDDEHGWSDCGIFNIEGGCYAKCAGLNAAQEPQIAQAIRRGALLENVLFREGSNEVDYANTAVTENTRVSYPLSHVAGAAEPSLGGHPRDIFLLACDAFGVLPALSRLNEAQAMYHFLSGYTAKVAGTETGVKEPRATFSACYGAPFLPLSPLRYARMLGERIRRHGTRCWLVNTGWSGGPCGQGERIPLAYTRRLVRAALAGTLEGVPCGRDPHFGLSYPLHCPGLPAAWMSPRARWADGGAYDAQARRLAAMFADNFRTYRDTAPPALREGGPC